MIEIPNSKYFPLPFIPSPPGRSPLQDGVPRGGEYFVPPHPGPLPTKGEREI